MLGGNRCRITIIAPTLRRSVTLKVRWRIRQLTTPEEPAMRMVLQTSLFLNRFGLSQH